MFDGRVLALDLARRAKRFGEASVSGRDRIGAVSFNNRTVLGNLDSRRVEGQVEGYRGRLVRVVNVGGRIVGGPGVSSGVHNVVLALGVGTGVKIESSKASRVNVIEIRREKGKNNRRRVGRK